MTALAPARAVLARACVIAALSIAGACFLGACFLGVGAPNLTGRACGPAGECLAGFACSADHVCRATVGGEGEGQAAAEGEGEGQGGEGEGEGEGEGQAQPCICSDAVTLDCGGALTTCAFACTDLVPPSFESGCVAVQPAWVGALLPGVAFDPAAGSAPLVVNEDTSITADTGLIEDLVTSTVIRSAGSGEIGGIDFRLLDSVDGTHIGVFSVTQLTIGPNATLFGVAASAANCTPALAIYARDGIVVDTDGTIDVSSAAGGPGPGGCRGGANDTSAAHDGGGPGGGTGTLFSVAPVVGGAGSFALRGSDGTDGAGLVVPAGLPFGGADVVPLRGGSGGGQGDDAAGGAGGGALWLGTEGLLTVRGLLFAHGGPGGVGNSTGGSGAGGALVLEGRDVTLAPGSLLNADGGANVASSGGVGRVRVNGRNPPTVSIPGAGLCTTRLTVLANVRDETQTSASAIDFPARPLGTGHGQVPPSGTIAPHTASDGFQGAVAAGTTVQRFDVSGPLGAALAQASTVVALAVGQQAFAAALDTHHVNLRDGNTDHDIDAAGAVLSVAIGGSGKVYVARDNGTIRVYDFTGALVETVSAVGVRLLAATDVHLFSVQENGAVADLVVSPADNAQTTQRTSIPPGATSLAALHPILDFNSDDIAVVGNATASACGTDTGEARAFRVNAAGVAVLDEILSPIDLPGHLHFGQFAALGEGSTTAVVIGDDDPFGNADATIFDHADGEWLPRSRSFASSLGGVGVVGIGSTADALIYQSAGDVFYIPLP